MGSRKGWSYEHKLSKRDRIDEALQVFRTAVVLAVLLAACSASGAEVAAGDPAAEANSTIQVATEGPIPRWPPVSLQPDEFFPRLVKCLQDNGYAVTLGPDYSISETGGSLEDASAYNETFDDCTRQIDPGYLEEPPPFTQAQLESLYAYLTLETQCLAEFGYPLVEMPSFERFSTDLEGRFDPVGELADIGNLPTDDEIRTCRQRDKPAWFVAP